MCEVFRVEYTTIVHGIPVSCREHYVEYRVSCISVFLDHMLTEDYACSALSTWNNYNNLKELFYHLLDFFSSFDSSLDMLLNDFSIINVFTMIYLNILYKCFAINNNNIKTENVYSHFKELFDKWHIYAV